MTIESAELTSALARRGPEEATACSGWRVHELTAHVAAGAHEIAQALLASLEDREGPPLRTLEERESPYRSMDDTVLRDRLAEHDQELGKAIETASSLGADHVIPWAGREVPAGFFATHARSEAAIHRWDLVGDDDTSGELLSQPDFVTHAIEALAPLLLLRGFWESPCEADQGEASCRGPS